MFSKKGEFLSTRSLIPIFPLEIKGFTLLEIFHLLFFFFEPLDRTFPVKVGTNFSTRVAFDGGWPCTR